MNRGSAHLQSILFDKNMYSLKSAIEFLDRHKLTHSKVHETADYYRFRQISPKLFKSFHVINIANGVKAIYAR